MVEIISQSLPAKLFGLALAAVEYDGELSAGAYLVLASVLMAIIGGLGWCFYRAMTAVGKGEEIQHHDEIGDENSQPSAGQVSD